MHFSYAEHAKEYGQIKDLIEDEPTEEGKKCLITVLFDALMIEKIKSYSLNYDAPAANNGGGVYLSKSTT